MTITLELPPQLEAELRQGVARRDAATVQRLLAEAFAPTVEELLREAHSPLGEEEFEAIADQLADELVACAGVRGVPLSDEAVTREGIYEDHP